MRLLQERVAVVAGLDCVVVASAGSELDVTKGALDVKSETDSIESLGLDSIVILFVSVRPRSDNRLLDILFPQGELLCLTLRESWPPLFGFLHARIVLVGVALVGSVVIHLDITVSIASAPIVVITVAKGARLLKINFLELRIPLDIVDMAWILVSSKFHCEERSAFGQVFFLWLIGPMRIL